MEAILEVLLENSSKEKDEILYYVWMDFFRDKKLIDPGLLK